MTLNAFLRYQGSWSTLVLFAVATAIAELTSAQLFQSSHSRISIVAVSTIAALTVLGPWGGALVSLAGGLMTVVTTSDWFTKSATPQKRAKWWRR